MRKLFLVYLIILIVISATVIGLGHYYDLWQGGFIRDKHPLEVKVVFPLDEMDLNYASVDYGILRTQIRPLATVESTSSKIYSLKVGSDGKFLKYLKPGEYRVTLSGIQTTPAELARYHADQNITLSKERLDVQIQLEKETLRDVDVIYAYVMKVLELGDFDTVFECCVYIKSKMAETPDYFSNYTQEIDEFIDAMEIVNSQLSEIVMLPGGSYNSRISSYQEILSTFQLYLEEKSPAQIIWRNMYINIPKKIASLARARDTIALSHLKQFQRFYKQGLLTEAMTHWIFYKSNPEIDIEIPPVDINAVALLTDELEHIQQCHQQFQADLEARANSAFDSYKKGRLKKAKAMLYELSGDIEYYGEKIRLDVFLKKEIDQYLNDIELINQGDRYYENDLFQRAKEYYNKVQHPSIALEEKMVRLTGYVSEAPVTPSVTPTIQP